MNKTLVSILKIIGAVISISIGAQLTIDIGSIPITGQTLFILIWAFFLRPHESFITLYIYLMFGILGLPVFADGSSGITKITGGSGGFLVGFLIAAVLVSQLNLRIKFTLLSVLVLTGIGTIVIITLGTLRLITIYGFEKGMEYGFYPFWKGAMVKIVIGSLIVWGLKKWIFSDLNKSNQTL